MLDEDRITFGQWFTQKRRAHRPKLSQADVSVRASRFVGMSQTYVSLIERTAGTADEPDVSPDRIIALAHALGENPSDALALRANVIASAAIPADEEFPLPSGGSIILRGRPASGLTNEEKRQLIAVLDALFRVRDSYGQSHTPLPEWHVPLE